MCLGAAAHTGEEEGGQEASNGWVEHGHAMLAHEQGSRGKVKTTGLDEVRLCGMEEAMRHGGGYGGCSSGLLLRQRMGRL